MSDWIDDAFIGFEGVPPENFTPRQVLEQCKEAVRRQYAAHIAANPPLTELAERIANECFVVMFNPAQMDGYIAAAMARIVTAHLTPLYAENERLKAIELEHDELKEENASLRGMMHDADKAFDLHAKTMNENERLKAEVERNQKNTR